MQNTQAAQPFPLAQLGAMADKQNLACIAGTLKAVWKPKSGTNATGEWSIQNATLVGTDGTEIGLWMKDRDELPQSAKGRFIVLTAHKGDKGLSGLYVMDDDYNGKITRKIKVTPTAEIAYSEPAGQAAPPPHANTTNLPNAGEWQADPPPPTAANPAQGSSPRGRQEADPATLLRDAQLTILQVANLHLLCARCVETYEAPRFKAETGQDMTEGQRQGAIASIFIESCRSGLVRSMPAKPM